MLLTNQKIKYFIVDINIKIAIKQLIYLLKLIYEYNL